MSSGEKISIIHKDICPANIMITYFGGVKIIDWGIAEIMSSNINKKNTTFAGKLSYASPEQLEFKELDHRTDIYSISVVLWELLTGRKLFCANNIEEHRILRQRKIPVLKEIIKTQYGHLPKGLNEILQISLSYNRENRFRSAQEYSSELKKIVEVSNPFKHDQEFTDILKVHFHDQITSEQNIFETAAKKI